MLNFPSRDFNFSARESIAILGIHSVIKHQSVNIIIVMIYRYDHHLHQANDIMTIQTDMTLSD